MVAHDYVLFLCGMLVGAFITLLLSWLYFKKRLFDLAIVQDNMKASFSAISKETLMANIDMMNASFKQSIEQIYKVSEQDRTHSQEHLQQVITPLKESLQSVDKKVQELESVRLSAYSGLKEQIEGLLKSQQILHKETNDLSRALNAPSIRGRWGEMQLRRVVELSGLSAHCDFVEQETIKGEHETVRPDMIVTLPNKKLVIIDAKAPLDGFSADGADNSKAAQLASSLRRHLLSLKKKEYYKFVTASPEFTVMFLPGEAFLYRALMADPQLLEFAAQNDVMVVTPITLIALLKAIAFGFRQEAVADNIEEVRRLAQQLIDRINKVAEHFDKCGRHLQQATQSYNQTLSSLDSRVLVTARKLAELKAVGLPTPVEESVELAFVDIAPKPVTLGPDN